MRSKPDYIDQSRLYPDNRGSKQIGANEAAPARPIEKRKEEEKEEGGRVWNGGPLYPLFISLITRSCSRARDVGGVRTTK